MPAQGTGTLKIFIGGHSMKTQMRFKKYLCLVMLIVGALAVVYSFCYATGGLAELGRALDTDGTSLFVAGKDKNDATLFIDIQGFNDALMYCGIVMVLLAVLLYITACNSRRNYYITNYVATGVCAGGNIIMSVILMALNGVWMGRFMNVDFTAWAESNADNVARLNAYYGSYGLEVPPEVLEPYTHYSESVAWFAIGFVVFFIVIAASVLLILNLVWKIKLMQGEKKLLNGGTVEGGVAV